ncbi:NADPH--cytochrome P450 reductase, putative [Plasmodium vinckei brucechwatti]|uniref:NADPH--cytochrome P450 reductase, putative n=1 Tax=Plasmodium vinckei brucechwatti TaxID=119398 RepID=A0A6V7SLZ8_PLAVN|nr:NADPH--cytochrome P450 reductase, putative [Plasmodium vinckei brucechwatti]
MNISRREQILLLYGSEYGTSYDCCRNILYELCTNFDVHFYCLNDVNIMKFYNYENIIIIVSTTGYGCPAHNMSKFWINLHKCNNIFHEDIYFHLFGLGDSSYDNYNAVAKKLKRKLISIGANIVNYSLGNYQHSSMHFTNFNTWKNKVYSFLKKKYYNFEINNNLPQIYSITNLSETSLTYEDITKGKEKDKNKIAKNYDDFNVNDYFTKSLHLNKFEVIKNERLTDVTYSQDVRYMELATPIKIFNLSSLITVHPTLNKDKTESVLSLLKINYNEYIIINQPNKNTTCTMSTYIPIGKKIKVLDLFVYFLDLNKIVTPFFFIYLSERTNSDIHKKKFLQLGNTNDISDYFSYVYQYKRSYYDIFYDFYSYIDIDTHFLLNTLPNIMNRNYSILNDAKKYRFIKNFNLYNLYHFYLNPYYSNFLYYLKINFSNDMKTLTNFFSYIMCNYTQISTYKYTNILKTKMKPYQVNNVIELLICLYQTEINQNKKHVGLCSNYLINSIEGSPFIYATIENSLLFQNKNIWNLNYRIVYISTGAAFSSLLGVIRQRFYIYNTKKKEQQKENLINNKIKSISENDLLFLGFRNKSNNFYFEQELQNYLHFIHIFIAFSQQPEDNFLYYNHDIFSNVKKNSHNDNINVKNIFNKSISEMKEFLKNKKKVYVTDIISMLQNNIYDLLIKKNTIFLVSGKSRPFSQNLFKLLANIMKEKEPNKTIEEINLFLKKKIDKYEIIFESWY